MIENPSGKYNFKTEHYDLNYEDYMNFEKKFGHFNDQGTSYTVTDRNTPRQWLNFMVNDTFASVAGNDGSGFTALNHFSFRLTKHYNPNEYLIRTLNGRRRIILTDTTTNSQIDLLKDCQDMTFTVTPGSVVYQGEIDHIQFQIKLFVPNHDTCECWAITLTSNDYRKFIITVGEDLAFLNMANKPKTAATSGDMVLKTKIGRCVAYSDHSLEKQRLYAFFGFQNGTPVTEQYSELDGNGLPLTYTKVDISKEVILKSTPETFLAISGAGYSEDQCENLLLKYKDLTTVEQEEAAVKEKWSKIIGNIQCEIPDKNLQYFLNVWLKNQIYLTLRYNRFDIMGYRDVLQDSWGHLLVNMEDVKPRILEVLSKMHPDGRCPRQYDRYSSKLDNKDFMDSPLWIPITICYYIKETGDFSILDEEISYLDSDKTGSVLDHILCSLDYLYHSREKNGLILMRQGDWLDGLSGIDKFGEATTVWGTMAAYHAQNLMAQLLRYLNQDDIAERLENRSKEYKEIVNNVGWDGNWYIYAFIDDEPIGSSKCHEGKIYLNPQSWAMMTGICNDEKRIKKINQSIATHLMSMYGPHLMAPPYTKHGEKCGRIQKQRPGTFANSAIYLHAASFLAMAKCNCAEYDEALDLIQRILPSHEDNCDSRRTMEPYCVGNVYYGVTHPCHGMNLFSWFTATPAWLIHCGFENLLGVKPEYDGLKIEAHEIGDWSEYSVNKFYRGTEYKINFKKGTEKGIYVEGKKTDTNIILSSDSTCNIEVIF